MPIFLGRSLTWPLLASTSNPGPRYFLIVFALAGDSTTTSVLFISFDWPSRSLQCASSSVRASHSDPRSGTNLNHSNELRASLDPMRGTLRLRPAGESRPVLAEPVDKVRSAHSAHRGMPTPFTGFPARPLSD